LISVVALGGALFGYFVYRLLLKFRDYRAR
jgi:hypothetical protein